MSVVPCCGVCFSLLLCLLPRAVMSVAPRCGICCPVLWFLLSCAMVSVSDAWFLHCPVLWRPLLVAGGVGLLPVLVSLLCVPVCCILLS